MTALPPNPLAPFLAAQGVVVLDGGLATELEARGHDLSDELWSARLLADDPEAIRQVHRDFLRAGADCIVTASYQATIEGFQRRGRSEAEAVALLRSAVTLAREARDAFWSDAANRAGRLRPLVAASVGPYGAARADGSEYTGAYDRDEAGLREFHRERFALLAASGADLLACETLPSRAEARALARLVEEHPATWAWMSFCCRDGARIADGSDFAALVAQVAVIPNLAAVGVNCTAPAHVAELVAAARAVTAKPIVVYPNSGEGWDAVARRWTGDDALADLGAGAALWRAQGAALVGGCCRVGPREIAALRRALLPPHGV
jgi:homocysteine S-methyltransferase